MSIFVLYHMVNFFQQIYIWQWSWTAYKAFYTSKKLNLKRKKMFSRLTAISNISPKMTQLEVEDNLHIHKNFPCTWKIDFTYCHAKVPLLYMYSTIV